MKVGGRVYMLVAICRRATEAWRISTARPSAHPGRDVDLVVINSEHSLTHSLTQSYSGRFVVILRSSLDSCVFFHLSARFSGNFSGRNGRADCWWTTSISRRRESTVCDTCKLLQVHETTVRVLERETGWRPVCRDGSTAVSRTAIPSGCFHCIPVPRQWSVVSDIN